MNKKYTIYGCLALLFVVLYFNRKYEVIAFHPFLGEGQPELTVMTWNVHSSKGADSFRQKKMADLILDVDADFVLLNEYCQDSCQMMDSILRMHYPYTEESRSHKISGDIFYSKRQISNSGNVRKIDKDDSIQAIKANIVALNDSILLFGVHMPSNSGDGSAIVNGIDSLKKMDTFYKRYKNVQEKRNMYAKVLKKNVIDSEHPVIVLGDMNDFSCSAPLDTLSSCGLTNSWWEGGNGYGHSFHTGWMWLRIDHILHSKELKLESIKVIETDLSDHNPVVAGFSLRKK